MEKNLKNLLVKYEKIYSVFKTILFDVNFIEKQIYYFHIFFGQVLDKTLGCTVVAL